MDFLREIEAALLEEWPEEEEMERLADGERLALGLVDSPIGHLAVGYGRDDIDRTFAYVDLELPEGWQGEIAEGYLGGTLTGLRFYRPEDREL